MSDPVGVDASMNAFHKHLDECRQCREQPFDLCESGQVIATIVMQAIAREGPTAPFDGALRGSSQR